MAKVQYGGGVTAISGSIGGWTFQRNRSGNIIRLRSSTFRSRTSLQNQAISAHVSLLAGYNALPQSMKDDWDLFALAHTKDDKFGTTRELTGQNWYESINFSRERLGSSRLDSPPMYQLPVGNTDFTLAIDGATIEVEKSNPTSPNDTSLVWWGTPALRRTTTSVRRNLRFLDVQTVQPFGVFDLTPAWESAFGCSWPSVATDADVNIFVGLQLTHNDSGITEPINIISQFYTNAPGGVGFQEIPVSNEIA